MIFEVSRAIREDNPRLTVGHTGTMDQSVQDSIGTQRLIGGLVGIFGGLALLITVVGFYGLLAYTVTQRTREIGVGTED
jgi:putative ABC transport system permease protein